DACNTDALESIGNSNPTATSTNPLVDQLETLTVETPIPTVKPKKFFDALQDPSWVEAIQEELLQFKIQKVWSLVDCPKGDPEYPARVYKVEKAMYRLHQAPRAWYDVRSSNTPTDKENPWGKDGTGKYVDLHLYRSMIESLMYLTASRLYIMFVVCACARHQVTPKECYLHAVKRIF
nr:hypothetical protein [Tanacetum cinerariifolium]